MQYKKTKLKRDLKMEYKKTSPKRNFILLRLVCCVVCLIAVMFVSNGAVDEKTHEQMKSRLTSNISMERLISKSNQLIGKLIPESDFEVDEEILSQLQSVKKN